jgi:hypothetical protein
MENFGLFLGYYGIKYIVIKNYLIDTLNKKILLKFGVLTIGKSR